MILAGDVGGTKCSLGLFVEEGAFLRPVFQRRLPTRSYGGFEELIEDFLDLAASRGETKNQPRIDAAGFGLAGVVVDGCLHAGNLPWILDVVALKRKLNLRNIVLLNDLVATAFSVDKLPLHDLAVLNQGISERRATQAVIAAGTGLGEAILFWDGQRYLAVQSEGGQTDFAPRTEREIELLIYLNQRLAHVSVEEILSGRGFRRIHEFLNAAVRHASFEAGNDGDAASEITQLALSQSCPVCVEAVKMWTEIYGAEAGNLALRAMVTGGVYVAGGIAPKILPKLKDGSFFDAFCGRSKLAPVLARIPVFVVTNEDAPLWGAAYQALVRRRASGSENNLNRTA